jgi:uncharacterized protein (TIGR02266 family)
MMTKTSKNHASSEEMSELQGKIALFKQLDRKRAEQGLTEDEEQQWALAKEWIERFAAQGEELPPSSRRSSLRVPSQLAVTFQDARGFAKAYLRNISEGGVYVATERDLRMRDRFRLTIAVQATGESIELPVEVVWVNRTPSPGSGLEPGVGVAWLELPPREKMAIKAMVHRALDAMAASGKP